LAPKKYKIVLVDDHEVVRAGLKAVIEAESDMEVIDQKSDALSALNALNDLKPDVLLVDVNMSGLSAFEMAISAKRLLPKLKVIFLTAFSTDSNLERALQCGASGFVSKSDSITSVVTAIREVSAGNSPFFSQDVKQRLVRNPKPQRQVTTSPSVEAFAARKSLLSPREREILCFVAQGQSAKQIGSHLTISAKTVERHKSNIMTKLHLHNQVDLTRYAIREGMICA
jgi:DNA-binding NarL/FixJ family response regulator